MTDDPQYMASQTDRIVISRQLDLNIYNKYNKSSVSIHTSHDQGHINVEQDVFFWENTIS